jgi:hypothetical protein
VDGVKTVLPALIGPPLFDLRHFFAEVHQEHWFHDDTFGLLPLSLSFYCSSVFDAHLIDRHAVSLHFVERSLFSIAFFEFVLDLEENLILCVFVSSL